MSTRREPRAVILSPAFGEWLQAQRGRDSHEAIAKRLRPFVADVGLKVPPSLIVKLEQGRVPSWPLLIGLAQVFDEPLPSLIARLVAALQLPDGRKLVSRKVALASSAPPTDTLRDALLEIATAATAAARRHRR